MAKKLLQLFMKNDPARAALWSAINAWVANRNEEPPVHQQEMVELVENAARNFGRRRSVSCRKGEHDACADDKCECRCHYTRRKSRFRPLRGQGEEARKARLARGLCPTHGVVLIPESVVWEKGAPVADLMKCSRKDCKFTTEANRREGT
jgi:hypothetical protein